jgi:hypothetical protein
VLRVKFFICTDLVFAGIRIRKYAMTDKLLCSEKKTVLNGTYTNVLEEYLEFAFSQNEKKQRNA